MNPYLIFLIGVFVGVILGFVIACLCAMAHTSDKPVDDAARWNRIRQEMRREHYLEGNQAKFMKTPNKPIISHFPSYSPSDATIRNLVRRTIRREEK